MTAQTTLYLVRHPATSKKEEKQRAKTKFGKQGVLDAHRIAKVFLSNPPDHIFSSEYLRAQEAAFILRNTFGSKNHNVKVDSLFNEISRPLVDGQPFSALEDYFLWRKNIIHYPTHQNIRSHFKQTGESHWDLYQRVGNILNLFSLPQYSNQVIAAYTHSQVIAMTKTRVQLGPNQNPKEMMRCFNNNFPGYSSISELEYSPDSGWTVVDFNNSTHLK